MKVSDYFKALEILEKMKIKYPESWLEQDSRYFIIRKGNKKMRRNIIDAIAFVGIIILFYFISLFFFL
jgi:hypothetical protein